MRRIKVHPSILKDQDYNRHLNLFGYVVIPKVLKEDIVDDLNQFFEQNIAVSNSEKTSATITSFEDFDKRASSSKKVKETFSAFIYEAFVDHRMVAGHYIAKLPNQGNKVNPHQEFSIVDESKHESLNIWSPFVNVDKMNGAIQVLEKSHLLSNKYRDSSIPSPYSSVFPDFAICKDSKIENVSSSTKYISERIQGKFKTININKGDVFVFFSSLIHCSLELRNNKKRIAIGGYVAPKKAALIHHYMNKEGLIEEYLIDEDFFLKYVNGIKPDLKYEIVRKFHQDFTRLNLNDIKLLAKISNIGILDFFLVKIKELFKS